MYSTYNDGKSVIAEIFIRTLKNKLYKHMTATGKSVYYDVLDDVILMNIMKKIVIVGDRFRIPKFKNIFAKGYTPNWSTEIFIVDKINDRVLHTYNIKDLNDEEIIGSFYDKELQKSIL